MDFWRGRGTIDALCALKEIVTNAQERYVLGIFLDISGPFNNVWWTLILYKLNEAGCPLELYKILNGYLKNRQAVLNVGGQRLHKTLTKGCPQGSVLGPILWNILFEDLLLQANMVLNTSIIAYADGCRSASQWWLTKRHWKSGYMSPSPPSPVLEYEGKLSCEKTKMMLLKGELSRTREQHIKIQDTRIQ